MEKFEIKNRYKEKVIFSHECESMKECVEEAVRRKVSLAWSDLCGAYLLEANLSGADLRGANLYGAYLYNANLRGADLSSADLRGADLTCTDLHRANLSGADLTNVTIILNDDVLNTLKKYMEAKNETTY